MRTCCVEMHLTSYPCTTPLCKGQLHVDGKALGLLRQTSKVAFGLCLLYHWLTGMFRGGVPWYGFWTDTLASYHGCAPFHCKVEQ